MRRFHHHRAALRTLRDRMFVAPEYRQMMADVGLTPRFVFENPAVQPWRQLADRDNATLDIDHRPSGRHHRFHVKRYKPRRGFKSPAEEEAQAYRALKLEGIPAPPLVAWGVLADGHSFVISEDLYDHQACDKLVEAGLPFASVLEPTADLAADLHGRGLHHRDLYLCHFFAEVSGLAVRSLKLIDVARVARLGGPFTRGRWIVKDLAQFWYSTTKLPVTDEQRDAWLARYGQRRGLKSIDRLKRSVVRKAASIAAHDARLNEREPTRNVSIPR